ncbi:MAG: 3-deoxy-D-manno-octulosonic acid transferase [Odoribacter sp.]|nr:3-deoxy-D-manno-octulosonic acid transferase [Odoribacter sp.]
MAFFYNLGIRAYTLAIRLASPFNEKAALWTKGRKKIQESISAVEKGSHRLVWFHAASLGEFEQGRPVMEALKKEQPETKILLTFFSPSGYEIRKNYTGADYIFYLPADTPRNARHFIESVQPDAAVFVKYEYWYNYLNQLNKRHIPTYLISAIFRKEQPFFKTWGGLHRKMLHFFTRMFIQDEESARLLSSIGIQAFEQTGDTRFDRVKQIADAAKGIDKVASFLNGAPAVICGSTWPPDEDLLLDYINRDDTPFKWIIAPHEIGENHIKSILDKCKQQVIRYSQEESDVTDAKVLIIDCIGLLSSIYRYGKLAYIGGGFGAGIHNTLEAAVYGIPVIFGPRYQKFNEAVTLIRQGGAFSIRNKTELDELLDSLLRDQAITETAGRQALAYVNSQLGATDAIMKYLV